MYSERVGRDEPWGGRSAPLSRRAVNLSPPPVARGLQPRERLQRWLGVVPGMALTTVTGAAGFGKSTLLVTWASRQRDPLAWLTADPGDADPILFAVNLARAVELAVPGLWHAVADLLERPDRPAAADLGRAFADDLAQLSDDLIVLIDDSHHLANGEAVRVLDALLARPPARLHLVLAGRASLPLASLGRLRLQGLVAELGERSLRLSAEESARLVGDAARNAHPAALAAALARLDGWPAGVRLLRLRLQDVDNEPVDPIAAVAAISENLAAEILDREPRDLVGFLEPLAVFSSITPDLAGRLQDAPPAADPGALLASLAARHLFVAPDAGEPGAYRLHGLLREALLGRLAAREGPSAVASLHRRAADRLIGAGRIDAAIGQLLDAGDTGAIVDLLAEQGIDLLARDDWAQVRRWLRRVPAEVVASHPELLVLRAHVERNQGAFAEASASLVRAAALLEEEPPGPRRRRWEWEIVALRCRAAATNGPLGPSGDVAAAAAEVMTAPEASTLARSFAILAWTLALGQEGRIDEAFAGVDRFLAGPWGGDPAVVASAMLARASLAVSGRDAAAMIDAAQAAADAGISAGMPRIAKWGLNVLAVVHLERHDFAAAEDAARRSLDMAPGEYLGAELEAVAVLVAILAAVGRFADAEQVIADLRARLGQPLPSTARRALADAQARLALAAGERPDPDWRAAASRDTAASPIRLTPQGAAVAGVALLAEGPEQAAAALELADAAIAAAGERHAGWHVMRVLPIRALALEYAGDRHAASAAISEALRTDPALVRRFLILGEPMARLLARLDVERPDLRRVIAPVLAAFRQEDERRLERLRSPETPVAAAASGGVRLTRRERQVLERFARHLTNEEIAAELDIAEATVKQHVSSLLRKLGAANRREAARVAPKWLAASQQHGEPVG